MFHTVALHLLFGTTVHCSQEAPACSEFEKVADDPRCISWNMSVFVNIRMWLGQWGFHESTSPMIIFQSKDIDKKLFFNNFKQGILHRNQNYDDIS